MSDGRVLVDTNILVYSVDRRDARKQTAAATALDELASAGLGVLSAQTLAEYYSALTSKSVLAEQVPAEMPQTRSPTTPDPGPWWT